MAKMTLEEEIKKLRKEREQILHRINLQKNRLKTETKKLRDERTHLLCFKAGHLEYVFPKVKDFNKANYVLFIEGLAKIPEVINYVDSFDPSPSKEVNE